MCLMRNHPYPRTDTWPWDTAEQVETALATMSAPESWAAMSLTGGATVTGPRERPGAPAEMETR
jgi:hypothetical protein